MFWPWLVGVLGFIVGYVLVAPLSCVTAASRFGATTEIAYTTCSSPLGIRYTGGASYNPPVWPALIAGLVGSFGAGALTRFALKDRRRGSRALRHEPESAGEGTRE